MVAQVALLMWMRTVMNYQHANKGMSTTEAIQALYAEGGIGAFYRGLGLKLCRAVPMSAVGFLVYEEAIRGLQRLRA